MRLILSILFLFPLLAYGQTKVWPNQFKDASGPDKIFLSGSGGVWDEGSISASSVDSLLGLSVNIVGTDLQVGFNISSLAELGSITSSDMIPILSGGVVQKVSIASLTGEFGDDLGNHTATETLKLNGEDITNVGTIGINGASAPDWLLFGAGTSLFFSRSSTVLTLNDNGSLTFNQYTSPTSFTGTAAAILATTSGGSLITLDPATVGGDNLGDHTATENLLMSSYSIEGIDSLFIETSGSPWTITTDANDDEFRIYDFNGSEALEIASATSIRFGDAYTFPASDGTNGQVLTTNGAGILSFDDVSGADNLGNHTATTNLDLSGNNIDDIAIVNLLDTNSDAVTWAFFEDSPAGNLVIQSSESGADDFILTEAGIVTFGGTTFPNSNGPDGYVLTSDGAGGASWEAIPASGGTTNAKGGNLKIAWWGDSMVGGLEASSPNTNLVLDTMIYSWNHWYDSLEYAILNPAFWLDVYDGTDRGFTNVPRQIWGPANGVRRDSSHNHIAFQLGRKWREFHPLDTVELYGGFKGGITLDSMLTWPYDSLVDIFSTSNVDHIDVFIFSGARGNVGSVQNLDSLFKIVYNRLMGLDAFDQTTMFLFNTLNSGTAVNEAVVAFANSMPPNVRAIRGNESLATKDGTHPNTTSIDTMALNAFIELIGGGRSPYQDTSYNMGIGPVSLYDLGPESSLNLVLSDKPLPGGNDYFLNTIIAGWGSTLDNTVDTIRNSLIVGNGIVLDATLQENTFILGNNNSTGGFSDVTIIGSGGTATATNQIVLGGGYSTALLGTFPFDIDQTVGAGQNGFVLTYNHSTGLIGLSAGSGGGDNLGDHTATTTLDLATNDIDDVGSLIFDDADADANSWDLTESGGNLVFGRNTFEAFAISDVTLGILMNHHQITELNGVVIQNNAADTEYALSKNLSDDLEFRHDGNLRFTLGADGQLSMSGYATGSSFTGTVDKILAVTSSGDVIVTDLSGDNLGNHTATTTLNLSGETIDSVGIFNLLDTDADGDYWAAFEDGSGNLVIQDSGSGADDFTFEANGNFTTLGTITVGAYTLPSIDGSNGQVLKTNGAGTVTWQNDNTSAGGGSGTTEYYFAGQSTATATIPDSDWTDVPINTEKEKDASFTHTAPNANITLDSTGTYMISVQFHVTTGTSRKDVWGKMVSEPSGGGGYTDVTGALSKAPIMFENAPDFNDLAWTMTFTYEATAGDNIKFQQYVDMRTTSDHSQGPTSVNIVRIK
jgi:hypothetical protein